MSATLKRKVSATMESSETDAAPSPFLPMFETFRSELDEHHDRRDRIGKASRDITAASKKIIFALQRLRTLNQPLPTGIAKTIQPHYTTISKLFATVAPELQSINAHRYNRQISPGIQEYMEACIFQHYLTTQTLLSHTDAGAALNALAAAAGPPPPPTNTNGATDVVDRELTPPPPIQLTPEDYLLGIFDATGELMRFAITNMATLLVTNNTATSISANTPTTATATNNSNEHPLQDPDQDHDQKQQQHRRTVLHDLQTLRLALCTLEARATFDGHADREVRQKLGVMVASVDKVERALYGLTVRGSERPVGWVPDLGGGEAAGRGRGGGEGDEEDG